MFRLQEPWGWLCTPTAREILEILEILGSKGCSQCRFRFEESDNRQFLVLWGLEGMKPFPIFSIGDEQPTSELDSGIQVSICSDSF